MNLYLFDSFQNSRKENLLVFKREGFSISPLLLWADSMNAFNAHNVSFLWGIVIPIITLYSIFKSSSSINTPFILAFFIFLVKLKTKKLLPSLSSCKNSKSFCSPFLKSLLPHQWRLKNSLLLLQ